MKNEKNTISFIVFCLLLFVSCGKTSKEKDESKLNEEQLIFCESFFIARQTHLSEKACQGVYSLLKSFRAKGYNVVDSFKIPENYDHAQKKAYAQSILKDLGIGSEEKYGGYSMTEIFIRMYSSGYTRAIEQPELKSELIEISDNGNEIWQIKDFQSMTQARLIVKKDGYLNIGKVTAIGN